MKSTYRTLVGKFLKILHGRSKHRQEDNIKMDFRITGCVGVYWIKLSQDRVQ